MNVNKTERPDWYVETIRKEKRSNNESWLIGITIILMCGLFLWSGVQAVDQRITKMRTPASIVQLNAALAQDTTGCLRTVLANRIQAATVLSEYDLATLSVPENCLEAKQADEREVERAKLKIEQQKLLNVNQ